MSNNDLIFLDNRAICSFIGVLERLADYGGIEVYFHFLRDTVKAAEICTLRAGRTEEMRNFKTLLLSTCQRLLESQKLAAFSSEPGVAALMDYLREPY